MEPVPQPPALGDDDGEFSITETQRGHWQIALNGKLWQQAGKTPTKVVDDEADTVTLIHQLRCSNWKSHRCPARGVVKQEVNQEVLDDRDEDKTIYTAEEFKDFAITTEEHSDSCPNVVLFAEVKAFVSGIKRQMAENYHLHFQHIYQQAYNELPDNVQEVVPSMQSLSSTAFRQNQKLERDPTRHLDLTMDSFPEPYLVVDPSAEQKCSFLRAIERTEPDADGNRATCLFLYTDEFLKQILRAKRLSTDGTFKGLSKCWKTDGGTGQLFVVFFYIGRRAVPGLYVIASHKTRRAYETIFGHIVQKAREFNEQAQLLAVNNDPPHEEYVFAPEHINIDFEIGIWSAVRIFAPAVHITGCNYHFTALLYKLIQDYGLRGEYHQPTVFPSVKEISRLVNALTFVPPDQVNNAFAQIEAYAGPTLGHNRIGQPTRRFLQDVRDRWLTRVPDWNCFALEEGAARTNNDAESWNMTWNARITSKNTLWQFLHQLQLSQQSQMTRYAQHLLGQQISRMQSQQQRKKETSISQIKDNFVNDRYQTLLDYCKALSSFMYSAP